MDRASARDNRYRRIAQTLVAPGAIVGFIWRGTRDGAKTRAAFVICAPRRVPV